VSASFRIAIVGSGPAGLSAAARAAELGLSHVLLEKTDHLSDTIYKYQKGKHVMATPVQLPLRSDLAFEEGRREAVLETWTKQAAAKGINTLYGANMVSIEGEKGDFSIRLASGDCVTAETVVLAVGTAGNPNKLTCEGKDLPHVQYQLDDPREYIDEHIAVIGAGDAGIENALGLAEEAEQGNVVTIVNKNANFARAKPPNVSLLVAAREAGRIAVMMETRPARIEPGWLTLDTPNGEERIRCDRVIARMGAASAGAFLKGCGLATTDSGLPVLDRYFESTRPGVYVIGALAGYPLIKHCMNQGSDVVEFINGNRSLKPADEPLLEAKFADIPIERSVDDWLEALPAAIPILRELTPLQMREFMLDSDVRHYRAGEIVFRRNDPGSSLFAIGSGSVAVQVDAAEPSITVPIEAGSIVGEVGLISGRRRGATVVAREDTVLVEVPRTAALRLMAQSKAAREEVDRISIERQLLQMFGSNLTPEDLRPLMASRQSVPVTAGEAIITEGGTDNDIYVIRWGSAVVEKTIGGRPVFLSYLPAGSFVGEMALLGGTRRTATVRAAIKSELIKLSGADFLALLEAKPALRDKLLGVMATRKKVNDFVDGQIHSFGSVVDMYSLVAKFLVDQGIGEATDLLLIDETLCVGCDNCERACADSHEGLSRLDREAGKTFAHLHVPTSCRHCEHPHCMAECPPDAIHRGQDGEVFIDETCIGCGNCQRNCPYGVISMEKVPARKPPLLTWLLAGIGPGPGEPPKQWIEAHPASEKALAVKCDMCAGIEGGPACVRACPTGAAIRVAPEEFLTVARIGRQA